MKPTVAKPVLHPKKWSLICWLLFLIWLVVSVMVNSPLRGTADEITDRQDGPITLPDGSRAYAYDAEVIVGFPLSIQHITKKKSKYNFVAHLGNIAITAINLLALVYCAQSFFGRFSLRTILGFVAIVAALIAIGQAVFITEREDGEFMYLAAIYFSPLVGVVPAFVTNYYRSK